jgi:DNA topoisomerase-1
MAQTASGRRQVLATVVNLLESTMIRIGNRAYARANGSFGLTTLESRHVQIRGTTLRFRFKGKSGKEWKLDIRDRRMVRIIKACQELPGQNLFGYIDETGACQTVTSADVNEYLRQISGRDITAKDFRTWNGTVVAATMLSLESDEDHTLSARKRNLTAVVRSVAAALGNTSAVCRKSYIHPEVVVAYLEGSLDLNEVAGSRVRGLRPEERRVALFLRAREHARSTA